MSFLENCRAFVGLDSTPTHGNLAAAEFAGQLCQDAGLVVEFQRESFEGLEQCNIIARPQAQTPSEEVLFQTHLDTVDAGHFGHWTKTQNNPFNASIYGDFIYGLGTANTKLDFLCKIEAARSAKSKSMRRPFVLAGTFGAQNGMAGAIKLIRRKKLNAKIAVIGEPTEMHLVHASKGLAIIEVSVPFSEEELAYRRNHDLQESSSSQSRMFSGRAAHSSNPKIGDNAIMKMLEYLAQLPDGIAVMNLDGGINYNSVPASAVLEIDMSAGFRDPILPKISRLHASLLKLESDLFNYKEEGFEPPHPTVNLGMIRTTEADIRITGSVRLPPSISDDTYEGWMRNLEEAVGLAGATFRVKDYRKGFFTSHSSPLVSAAQGVMTEFGLDTELRKATMTSEASVFSRLGMECIMWGPGQSVGNSHAPNECIKISDLHKAIAVYSKFMERLCL